MRQSTRADPQHSGIAWYSASQQVCCLLTLGGAIERHLELVAAAQPPAPAVVAGLQRRRWAGREGTPGLYVQGKFREGGEKPAPSARPCSRCTCSSTSCTHLSKKLALCPPPAHLLPTQPARRSPGPHTAHPNRINPTASTAVPRRHAPTSIRSSPFCPATARVTPGPATRQRAGSALDCSQPSSSHSPTAAVTKSRRCWRRCRLVRPCAVGSQDRQQQSCSASQCAVGLSAPPPPAVCAHQQARH